MGGKFDPEHFAIERNVASIFTFPCATDGHDGNRRRENLSNAANCPGGADRGSPPRARRRGDRIAGRLLRYMSHLFGTERTYRAKLATSAFAAARRDHTRRPAQGDGDESDDALLRMPFKDARAAAIDGFEERYVLHLLERTQHNVSKAARLAGIDRNYLYRMMKKHGIARKE